MVYGVAKEGKEWPKMGIFHFFPLKYFFNLKTDFFGLVDGFFQFSNEFSAKKIPPSQ